ncbi:MAG: hypothetical protein FJW31_22100 [Acidobacteria bacterium]|nr:hypothetical protein [Acidobacteriota bacterium]
MIANAEKPAMIMPGLRKAAILMVAIVNEVGIEVMGRLTENEAALLSREIARLPLVPAEMAEAVLEEGYQMTLAHNYVVKGGVDYARKMLLNAYGPDIARKLVDRRSHVRRRGAHPDCRAPCLYGNQRFQEQRR